MRSLTSQLKNSVSLEIERFAKIALPYLMFTFMDRYLFIRASKLKITVDEC